MYQSNGLSSRSSSQSQAIVSSSSLSVLQKNQQSKLIVSSRSIGNNNIAPSTLSNPEHTVIDMNFGAENMTELDGFRGAVGNLWASEDNFSASNRQLKFSALDESEDTFVIRGGLTAQGDHSIDMEDVCQFLDNQELAEQNKAGATTPLNPDAVMEIHDPDYKPLGVCAKMYRYVTQNPGKTVAAVAATALAVGAAGYLLNEACKAEATIHDADEAGVEGASDQPSTGPAEASFAAQSSGFKLPEDTILFVRNKGWFTMQHGISCEKSGLDGQKVSKQGSILTGGQWDVFHIPKGSEGCALSGSSSGWHMFKRDITGSQHKQTNINGNDLMEHHSWGFAFAKHSGWQKPSGWRGSDFPMIQSRNHLDRCLKTEHSYACRGGHFPHPRQYYTYNQCLHRIQATINTDVNKSDGSKDWDSWGCSDNRSPCLKVSNEHRTGKVSWDINLKNKQNNRGYGCNQLHAPTNVKIAEWGWTYS